MAIRSDGVNGTANHTSMTTGTSSGYISSVHTRGNGGLNGHNFSVSEGQVLKGTVTDVRGNQVTIELEDGSSFTGRLSNASNYSIGQTASFKVTSTSAQTIYLQSVGNAMADGMEEAVWKALDEAGLPRSPRNTDIVRSLLNNHLSISKNSIQDAIRLCTTYGDNNVDSVITMKHLGMEMTPSTVNQFENYQNQTHQLINKMDVLSDSINEVLDLVGSHAPQAAKTIGTQILNMALESSPFLEEPATPAENPTIDLFAGDDSIQAFTITDANGNETLITLPSGIELTQGQSINEEGQIVDTDGTILAQIQTFEDGTPILTDLEGNILTSWNGESISEDISLFDNITDATTALVAGGDDFAADETGAILDSNGRDALTNLIKDFAIPEEIKTGITNGTAKQSEVLSALKSAFAQMDGDVVADLLASKDFQALVKNQLLSGWTISPKALTNENSVEKLYEKIDRQMTELGKLSENVLSQKAFANMSENAGDMKDNLSFMKMLNDSFTYMQLPLKLSEYGAHGDLYVMTKKEALKKDPNHLSVLLHLEMENLGTVDIHIKKENTNISSKFYVENDKVAKLFSTNMELLSDAINEQGYSFSSETNLKEKDVDIVKDFIAKDVPIGDLGRYNFDLRA